MSNLEKGNVMTDTPSLKRAYNLGLKAVPNFATLPDEVTRYYLEHLDEIPHALAQGFVLNEEIKRQYPFFFTTRMTHLSRTCGKETARCFIDPAIYWHRDRHTDHWLSYLQPEAEECEITTLGSLDSWTFKEAAEGPILNLTIPGSTTSLVGQELVNKGHTITLAQAEKCVKSTYHRHTHTAVLKNGDWNFFFVATGNTEEPVVVVGLAYIGNSWDVSLHKLDSMIRVRKNTETRLLVRNLQT